MPTNRHRGCSVRVLPVAFTLALVSALGPVPAQRSAADAPVGVLGTAQLVANGDPAKRITLVLLGDGYTAAELPRFRSQAAAVWRALTQVEPFRSYQRFFDVRRVDVVSRQSGLRAGSPLGMRFGCEGIDRLLCADDRAVAHYAGGSGGPEYLLALANSAGYGGEGGDDGLATLAAGSPDAALIVQHEMGHTVGALGDEYDAAPADDSFPNVSAADGESILQHRVKWWRWLGAADPTGGTVGTYRSGNGMYRPTRESIMRTLGGAYNLPCREALIESFYRQVGPVDGAEPAPGPVTGAVPLRVLPIRLVGARQLAVRWQVDGRPAPAAAVHGTRLDPARLGLAPGSRAEVSATVQDTTPWLRDEAFRSARMTATVTWEVQL
jgi:hypothetical protein